MQRILCTSALGLFVALAPSAAAEPVGDLTGLLEDGPDPGNGCRPYCLSTTDETSQGVVELLLGPDPGSGCRPYC